MKERFISGQTLRYDLDVRPTVMVSTPPTAAGRNEGIQFALERVLQSEAFRKTPSLRHLLEYLVEKSVEGHPEQLKESVVAIEVFSRRNDFDGRIDNIVRVQAHRLRKLLDGYYADEGQADTVRFSVPKGRYVPQVEFRETPTQPFQEPAELTELAALPDAGSPTPEVPAGITTARLVPKRAPLVLAFVGGAVFAAFAMLTVFHWQNTAKGATEPRIPPAVAEIWKDVFEPGARVVATFTNPAFLVVGHSGLMYRYNGPLSAPSGAEVEFHPDDPYIDRQLIPRGQKLRFSEGWTGTGEVLAVNRLSLLGADFHNAIHVIPSRLLGLNDVQGANVIFLGSPWLNGTLARTGDQHTPLTATDDGRILVRNPGPGEPASYANERDASTHEVVAGFTLFSVLPALDGDRRLVTSAGLGTGATWAGIEFTTGEAGASRLAAALKAANGGRLPRYYQVVIRAEVIKGMPSNPSLVMVRIVKPAGGAQR
jgi:hypothetical protein